MSISLTQSNIHGRQQGLFQEGKVFRKLQNF